MHEFYRSVDRPVGEWNRAPTCKPELLQMPAGAYAQQRAYKIVKLANERSAKKRVLQSIGAIALEAEIVNGLVGIERETKRPRLHHGVIQSIIEFTRGTWTHISLGDRSITDRSGPKPEMP